MSQTRELAEEGNVFGSWFWKPGSLRIWWWHLLKGLVLGHIVMEGHGNTYGGAEDLAGSFLLGIHFQENQPIPMAATLICS